jgi:hypothetical protein
MELPFLVAVIIGDAHRAAYEQSPEPQRGLDQRRLDLTCEALCLGLKQFRAVPPMPIGRKPTTPFYSSVVRWIEAAAVATSRG